MIPRPIRWILDWIQLPVTILFILTMSEEDKSYARDKTDKWRVAWRKNSYSFRIVRWFLG